MDTSDTEGYTRRRLLRAGAGVAAAGAVTAATAGTASAQDQYGGHLSDTGNFEGTADARGLDEVPLQVGVGSDGLLFGPTAAVLVDPGASVVWEWTGRGGRHNVRHTAGESEPAFYSGDPVSEAGHTFEYTFEEEGVFPYICVPHETAGMKGVIVVGEDNAEGDLVEFEVDLEEGPGMTPVWGGAFAFGLVSFIGVAAYRALVDGEL